MDESKHEEDFWLTCNFTQLEDEKIREENMKRQEDERERDEHRRRRHDRLQRRTSTLNGSSTAARAPAIAPGPGAFSGENTT